MGAQHEDGVIRNLPAVIRPAPTFSAPSGSADASFVTQLLAARQRLPLQRALWRAEPAVALGAYDGLAAGRTKRMPLGYRRTVIV